ncbi:hypothetical protein BDW59DRAFT_159029 [Aspergillus cavernicola]|uniref:Uncharacterized protein n=1 Tax=Aspergillus cavernicola TaxID=176166 RepID=A0ABR4IRK0_9EURO
MSGSQLLSPEMYSRLACLAAVFLLEPLKSGRATLQVLVLGWVLPGVLIRSLGILRISSQMSMPMQRMAVNFTIMLCNEFVNSHPYPRDISQALLLVQEALNSSHPLLDET